MNIEKKHIVVDCRMINKSGIGTYLKNILPEIISYGKYRVTCLGYDELKTFYWFDQVVFIPLKAPILSIKEQFELFLKIPKCDLFWSPNWNVPLFPIRAKNRIVTIHDVYHLANAFQFSPFKISMVKFYMFFIKSNYKNVITVSEFSKNEIIKFTKIVPDAITVIFLSVDDNFSSKVLLPEILEDYILYVGNVKPHKNLRLSLEAFSKIEDKTIKFYIVGQKEGFITSDKSLSEYILNLKERVSFTGYVSDDELKNYYKNAKLFLFPSTYEGFGLPILEAMKFKLPIIASNSASIPEVAGKSVIYFDSTNVNDLVSKLNGFLTGEIKCQILDYEDQLKKFNWKRTAQQHLDIFDSFN
ncbi:glycosyltransferase family 4 protein [Flavobacterium aquiphilum]|uniref:glycosyltransferase family 4 protein n=1 Tax=Flavobacterium aquiphilum TaxID=3003261 RepID=UPI00248096E4|nr:glycosyltransferase family 1 protein [Flavobacterium aquiphilum]